MASAFTTHITPDDLPRGSMARKQLEMGQANGALDQNAVLAAAGSTTATITSRVNTANTVAYLLGGKFYSLTATDPLWTLGTATSNTTVKVSSFQKYILCVDSAQAAYAFEGIQAASAATVTWTNINAVSAYGPLLYVLNLGYSIISMLQIATDATHTFIPGTTLLGAAGITATVWDGIDASLFPLLAVSGPTGAQLVGSVI